MPEKINLLKVFVASPSDVNEERQVLENLIRELNYVWGSRLHVMLNLVRWETHAYPGISEDAQSVIREQLGEDYDIFIGILWKRFGTPTKHADSGTDEEFNLAYKRYQENPKSIRLMIYFKDTPPLSLTEIDPEQLLKINSLRVSIGEKGGLYWTYKDVREFESLVRIHLSRQVQAWNEGVWGSDETVKILDDTSPIIKDTLIVNGEKVDEEYGFLELVDIGFNSFEQVNEASQMITLATQEIGEKVVIRTEEINNLSGNERMKLAGLMRIADHLADDMNEYVSLLDPETEILQEKLSKGLDIFSKVPSMILEFLPASENNDVINKINRSIEVYKELQKAIVTSNNAMHVLRDSIATSPSLTIKFNRAKRSTISSIDALINVFDGVLSLMPELEKSLNDVTNQINK
jgi:hypothetical protein